MRPIRLPANQPPARFYRGGAQIARFRGDPPPPSHTPEDWVASTTSVRGDAPVGLTRLADGELLVDAVARDPIPWLGAAHLERYGADTMLLVKLLDAGQRLPVHAHPDGAFAREHLAAAHGKAEAWYLLTPGTVHLGFVRDVGPAELRELVATQDPARMLALMHEVHVEPGDSVYVPPGMLHAIGEGVLLAEVQEPEDLSILLEWTGFELDGERDGHLGLGFDLALAAVDSRGRRAAEIDGLVRRGVRDGEALVADARPYFRLDAVEGTAEFPAGFAIIIALDDIELTSAVGVESHPQGSTVLVPHAAGDVVVAGRALVARPPDGA